MAIAHDITCKKSTNPKGFHVSFSGVRNGGMIQSRGTVQINVYADTEEMARIAIYQEWEHLMFVKITPMEGA
jgi:hypothetical protein